jgi:hypothetical protein
MAAAINAKRLRQDNALARGRPASMQRTVGPAGISSGGDDQSPSVGQMNSSSSAAVPSIGFGTGWKPPPPPVGTAPTNSQGTAKPEPSSLSAAGQKPSPAQSSSTQHLSASRVVDGIDERTDERVRQAAQLFWQQSGSGSLSQLSSSENGSLPRTTQCCRRTSMAAVALALKRLKLICLCSGVPSDAN